MTAPLIPGAVVWADFGSGVGREQSGKRPAVVVSSHDHIEIAETIITLLPCTSRDRQWPNHIRLSGPTGLPSPTYAMTEQVRTVSRERLGAIAGRVDDACLDDAMSWCRRWLAGPVR